MAKGENILKVAALVGSLVLSAVSIVNDGKELKDMTKTTKK